jgi:hypothetical protein
MKIAKRKQNSYNKLQGTGALSIMKIMKKRQKGV